MTALWWQAGVIYQIYARSFQDTNNDGIGDLTGIGRRLNIVSLGVDAIWISPVYPSPMVDFGYDVADYCDVDPRFGSRQTSTIPSPRKPIGGGLRFCSTFVPNHTSDQHPWFVESRSSRENQKKKLVHLARSCR